MYGLIGQLYAVPGKRDALVAILSRAHQMPGCKSYVVALDTKDADSIWITEVWDSKENHGASLKLASVQGAITEAKPLIARFGAFTETSPVAGV